MLNAQIGATKSWNGQYQVDCAKVPDLPDLSFYFNGRPYPLKGTDYILEVQGTCISSFTGLDINLPGGSLWIIGGCHPVHDPLNCIEIVIRRRFPSPLLHSL